MMREYHQPYSEIKKMKIKELMFYAILLDSMNKFEQQEIEKAKNKMNKRKY
jgi:hypothetical protein